eukprot:5530879-Amphidinium_carterae.2
MHQDKPRYAACYGSANSRRRARLFDQHSRSDCTWPQPYVYPPTCSQRHCGEWLPHPSSAALEPDIAMTNPTHKAACMGTTRAQEWNHIFITLSLLSQPADAPRLRYDGS